MVDIVDILLFAVFIDATVLINVVVAIDAKPFGSIFAVTNNACDLPFFRVKLCKIASKRGVAVQIWKSPNKTGHRAYKLEALHYLSITYSTNFIDLSEKFKSSILISAEVNI